MKTSVVTSKMKSINSNYKKNIKKQKYKNKKI